MNRNGMNGYRIPASKKKKRDEENEGEAAQRGRSASPSKPPRKKRGRVKHEDDLEGVHDDKPAPKKARTAPIKGEEEDKDLPKEDQQRDTKGRKKGTKIKSEMVEDAAPLDKCKAKDHRKLAKVKSEDVDAEAGNGAHTNTTTKGRKKVTNVKSNGADGSPATLEAPKKRGRRRMLKGEAEPDSSAPVKDEGIVHEITAPSTRKVRAPRKLAPKKTKAEGPENGGLAMEDTNAAETEIAGDNVKVEDTATSEVEPIKEEPQPKKGRKKATTAALKGKSSNEAKNAAKAKATKDKWKED
ncbi:MAG: hypothetical protein Q9163_002623 [Psora crenata]